MPSGITRALDDFSEQIRFFQKQGLVCYSTLLRSAIELLAGENPVTRTLRHAWEGREFSAPYERPLLFCAVLRAAALASSHHPLRDALGTTLDGQQEIDRNQLLDAWETSPHLEEQLRTRVVQTNEVSRAICWILAAREVVPQGTPLVLVDIGCSAGLNLIAHELPLRWLDLTRGTDIVVQQSYRFVARVGLDRKPLDPSTSTNADWLRACIWPGQTERLRRLDLAIELARAARERGELQFVKADCTEASALLHRMTTDHPTATVLAYQTVVRDYLPPQARSEYERNMHEWILGSKGRGLWCELEGHGRGGDLPASISLHVNRAGRHEQRVLAHTQWHPAGLRLVEAPSR
ncbi:MAG: DUF2332 family protein [Polyangiaceae bacterium]